MVLLFGILLIIAGSFGLAIEVAAYLKELREDAEWRAKYDRHLYEDAEVWERHQL